MSQRIAPDDPRLSWYGQISFEHGSSERGAWVKPWRIPYEQRLLFGKVAGADMMISRSGMASGVRIAFRTSATSVSGEIEPLSVDPFPVEQSKTARIDLACDGVILASKPLLDGTEFHFDLLPPGEKLVELWLPEYRELRLHSIEINDGASLAPYDDPRPQWLVYGSSNTQCRGAESPAYTWPAVAARQLDLNLTNLGYGSECHLDSMVARMMRDRPADIITMEVGINIYINATLNPRSLRAAYIGFVQILRERHPTTPIIVLSSIFSHDRETTPNAAGFTLAGIRAELAEAAETMRSAGDTALHYVDGLSLFGPDLGGELPDQLHPSPAGYKILGKRFATQVAPRYFPGT